MFLRSWSAVLSVLSSERTVVPASANPGIVPPPLADPAAADPVLAFLASIASCHMLWFLDYARRGGFAVAIYEDAAEAALEECDDRRYRITKVTLHPRIDWAGDGPDAEALAELHHKAHDSCFIANSITAEVVVEPA